MTNNVYEKIKKNIRFVLSELKPGIALKRKIVWNIVHARLIDESVSLMSNIHDIFYGDDDRLLRKIVEGLRGEGLAVGSSSRGYFMIYGQKDLDEAIGARVKKIRGQVAVINMMKKNAEEHIGQKLSTEAFYGDGNIGANTQGESGKQETLFNIHNV